MERQRRGNGRIQEEIQAFNNQAQAADSLIGQRYGMVKMLHGKLSHFKIHIIEGHLSVRTSLQFL